MPSDTHPNDHVGERAAVEAACAQVGIDSRGMYLMRRHANAIYHLPRSGAVARVRDIAALNALSAAVQATGWLAAQDFPAAYHGLPWVLRPGIVHGDAHTNNLLPHPGHGWVLIDWDSVSAGPPECDFMPIYNRPRRFGYPQREWRDFTAAYGTDLSDWPGLATLAQIREIRSLAAFIRNAPTSNTARHELDNRLSSLMDGDRTRRWHAL